MKRSARIRGTGSFLPPNVEDNRALYARPSIRDHFDVERAREALHELPARDSLAPEEVFDHWARQVTGIEERRVLEADDDGFTTEHMCAEAARGALAMAGRELEEVDLIIAASVTPSDSVPNAACTIGQLLGRPDLGGFSLNGACAGFIHAVGTAQALVEMGSTDSVLAISGDTLSRITNYEDPKTAVLFSDGAGAALVTAAGEEEPGIDGPPFFTSDYAREHLYLRGQGWEEPQEPVPKLHMGGGPRVLRRAIAAMVGVTDGVLERAGLTRSDVDFVVPHQANLRITRGLEKHLELERGRVVHTIQRYGNASASTVGIALDEVLRGRHGVVPDPARIVLTAVGGGYTMGALSFQWSGGAAG